MGGSMILQLLEIAEKKQDWDIVRLVITDLKKQTVKTVEPTLPVTPLYNPTVHENIPEERNPIISTPNNPIVPTHSSPSFVTSMKGATQSKPSIIDGKNYGRKLPFEKVSDRPNLFTDGLQEETGDTKQANPQLQILYGNKKRQPKPHLNPYVKAKCSSCGTIDEVSPIIAAGYSDNSEENTYKCNNCIQQAIRNARRE